MYKEKVEKRIENREYIDTEACEMSTPGNNELRSQNRFTRSKQVIVIWRLVNLRLVNSRSVTSRPVTYTHSCIRK